MFLIGGYPGIPGFTATWPNKLYINRTIPELIGKAGTTTLLANGVLLDLSVLVADTQWSARTGRALQMNFALAWPRRSLAARVFVHSWIGGWHGLGIAADTSRSLIS